MAFKTFQKNLTKILLFIALFFSGYYIGVRGIELSFTPKVPKFDLKNRNLTVSDFPLKVTNKLAFDTTVDFNKFWQVWNTAVAGKSKLETDQLYYAALTGMVASLDDPYTAFLPPQVNKTIGDELNGKYQGIGAELGMDNDQLIIVAPLDGSPAKAAGLKSGDKILKINGQSAAGLSVSEAAGRIRGDAGTQVILTTQTGVDAARDVPIVRGVITVSSVTWQDKGNGTAYIRISRFGGDTNKEWDSAVSEISLQMKELDAVVIDVRGNPGGYLQSAAHIAEEFYNVKPVLYQEDATGKQTPINAARYGSFTKVPAVYVLIDQGSASASEILAGALRSTIHAKLIGVKSFGKGTVQDARDFKDGSGVHITIAKWLTPDKEWVHKKGLEPDVNVELSTEDSKNGVDMQLNKALDLAKEQ